MCSEQVRVAGMERLLAGSATGRSDRGLFQSPEQSDMGPDQCADSRKQKEGTGFKSFYKERIASLVFQTLALLGDK